MTRVLLVFVFTLIATSAFSHTGAGDTAGLVHGLLHPIGGLDHVLAMVAVGVFAALLGGRSLWLVPAAFVSMMVIGGTIGVAGVLLPMVEIGIALSIVALGVAVALRLNMPVVLAMAFVGFFAIFHGHAHGTEMPDSASGMAYGAGFVLATALLHACGIGLAFALAMLANNHASRVAQLAGGTMALTGIAILSGVI
jgi:urease accessory protein